MKVPQPTSNAVAQSQNPLGSSSEFNAIHSIIWGVLKRLATGTLGKVVRVHSAGEVAPVGFVDIQPLVNQMDAINRSIPFGVVHQVPFFRLQGGASAVIMDPTVGDIGWVAFADRDISSVTATRGQANPGSRRRFDLADAFFFPCWSGVTPGQYVQFNDAGITLHSPAAISIEAPDVRIIAQSVEISATTGTTVNTPTFRVNGATVLNGPLSQVPGSQGAGATGLDGPVTVANDLVAAGKSVSAHHHQEHDGPPTSNPI